MKLRLVRGNIESTMKDNKILLVDDEPDVTTTFKLTLESAGYIVDTYHDPLLALSRFKPSKYNMVILDIKMPRMDGLRLYEEMRRVDNQVKVCFITAGEMYYDEVREKKGEEEEQYCKPDAEQFLQKPISNLDLVNKVDKIMMTN